MKDWKIYLQPAATLLVALSLGFIAIDQYRTTNARFNCAQVFGTSLYADKALAKLGLPTDGSYRQVNGYCRAFVNPRNSDGGSSSTSIDFPSSIDVNITRIPTLYGDMGISGSVDLGGGVATY